MVKSALGNAARCSNIIEFRLEDFVNVIPTKPPKKGMDIFSYMYKTSIYYGKKTLYYPDETFIELSTYIERVRSFFIPSNNKFVFTSLWGCCRLTDGT